MAGENGLKRWLQGQRTSTRLAYALQLGTRICASFMGLIWIRLLVGAMGRPLNGVLLAFQNVITLGGLGDLGMGGAVGIRTGQYLGRGDEAGLKKFLVSARAVFLLMALAVGGGFLAFSPWLPHWLGFKPVPGTGSFTLLFAVGAVLIGGVMLSSYLTNLNYACGNVTWPVVPAFVLLQVGLLFQWLLARQHEPLWVQFLPSVGTAAAGLWLYRFYISKSHPPLAAILPLKPDWRMAAVLFESSFWVYLCTLGNAIYRATDSLVINAGFPAGTLPDYIYNYKFCDLVVFLALTAGFVSLPKITQWMASTDAKDQERVRVEMRRLNQFQTLLGCGLALAYLAGNNLFMKIWWLHNSNPVPPAALGLQTAFALNMAITASGDVGIQMSMRSGKNGLRFAGLLIGVTGLLNVVLSLVAMERGSLPGIAMATVLAQSLLSVGAGFYTCRHLRVGWVPWLLKGWLLPCAGIVFAAWLRLELPFYSAQHVLLVQNVLLLGAAYLAAWLAAAWGLGMNADFIRHELALIRTFFRS
jgi:O-antigen/teichoic acid export membrane protein